MVWVQVRLTNSTSSCSHQWQGKGTTRRALWQRWVQAIAVQPFASQHSAHTLQSPCFCFPLITIISQKFQDLGKVTESVLFANAQAVSWTMQSSLGQPGRLWPSPPPSESHMNAEQSSCHPAEKVGENICWDLPWRSAITYLLIYPSMYSINIYWAFFDVPHSAQSSALWQRTRQNGPSIVARGCDQLVGVIVQWVRTQTISEQRFGSTRGTGKPNSLQKESQITQMQHLFQESWSSATVYRRNSSHHRASLWYPYMLCLSTGQLGDANSSSSLSQVWKVPWRHSYRCRHRTQPECCRSCKVSLTLRISTRDTLLCRAV